MRGYAFFFILMPCLAQQIYDDKQIVLMSGVVMQGDQWKYIDNALYSVWYKKAVDGQDYYDNLSDQLEAWKQDVLRRVAVSISICAPLIEHPVPRELIFKWKLYNEQELQKYEYATPPETPIRPQRYQDIFNYTGNALNFALFGVSKVIADGTPIKQLAGDGPPLPITASEHSAFDTLFVSFIVGLNYKTNSN